MLLILKNLQSLVCLRFVLSRNTSNFGRIPFALPTLSLTRLLKALLPGHGASITGFVRYLTLFRGCWNTRGLAACEVLWSSRYGVLLRSGHFSLRTAFIWRILSKIGWTSPLWRRFFALVPTALVCLAERILTLGFWLFILISDLCVFFFFFFFFLMPGFALAIEVGVLAVRLHQFGKLLFFIFISVSLPRLDVWDQWVASW